MGNQATALTPQIMEDLEESTAFTPSEIRVFYKNFLKNCDENRMSLSKEQFREQYSNTFPAGDAAAFSDAVFENFDQDGNGRIDFREFLMSVSVHKKGSVEEKLRWTFDLFDIDDNGYITKQELFQLVQSMKRLHPNADLGISEQDLVNHIMSRADANKDDKLTMDEFIQSAMTSKTMELTLAGAFAAVFQPLPRQPKK